MRMFATFLHGYKLYIAKYERCDGKHGPMQSQKGLTQKVLSSSPLLEGLCKIVTKHSAFIGVEVNWKVVLNLKLIREEEEDVL